MANYQRQINTAKRLIKKYGQRVSWRTLTENIIDSDKSWNGGEIAQRETPVMAIFFPITRLGKESLHFAGAGVTQYGNTEQVVGNTECYFVPNGFDPTMKDVLIRGDVEYRLTALTKIQPAEQLILCIAEFTS